MKIIIERIWSNASITHGVLTIEGTGFRCHTMELGVPQQAVAKGLLVIDKALPEGTYPVFTNERYGFPSFPRIWKVPGYTTCRFTNISKADDLCAGQVSIGTEWENPYLIKGFDLAAMILCGYIDEWLAGNCLSKASTRNHIELQITRSPYFVQRTDSYEDFRRGQRSGMSEDFVGDYYANIITDNGKEVCHG